MQRCSEFAYAMCPDRAHCGSREDAVFMEGSECAAFNRLVEDRPMTNADRIRSATDVEMVKLFWTLGMWDGFDDSKFCTGGCNEKDVCDLCRLKWLGQPAEVSV